MAPTPAVLKKTMQLFSVPPLAPPPEPLAPGAPVATLDWTVGRARAALAAVMRPDGSPYLYFVSKNDGTHQFSATLAEHEAAVVKYQRGGKPLAKGKP